MAKTDWKAVAEQYERDRSKTGVSAKEWCEQRGINYASARRYLKSRGANDKAQTSQVTAQTAQKKLRKTAQGEATAQNDQEAQDSDEGRDGDSQEQSAKQNPSTNGGRDASGRFTHGNSGNPDPVTKWRPGVQLTKTHGGYAKYLEADELFDEAEEMQLADELVFTRARALSVTKTLKQLHQEIAASEQVDDKVALYDKIFKAEQALDRNMARIESLTRTLSALRLDDATEPKLKAETVRIKAATRKLDAETNKLGLGKGDDITFNLDW